MARDKEKPRRRCGTVSSTSESSSVTKKERKKLELQKRRHQSATSVGSEGLKGHQPSSSSSQPPQQQKQPRSSKAPTSSSANKSIYETDKTQTSHIQPFLDRDRPITRLQIQRFEEFTREALTKGVNEILDEYYTHLKNYSPQGITSEAFELHMKKNRYRVICIDRTRVILKNYSTDYIHANYVRGDPLINSFICTQGPTVNSIRDFWKMIAQERVGNIVMLCDTVEKGKDKCYQYWPREEGRTVEWLGIIVRNVKVENSDPTIIVSTIELIMDKKDKYTLKHLQWKTWPDKSVPTSVTAPFRILRSVRHSPRPTVVHCSAGIGRTGSVVALELCYQQMLSENKLSVLDSVKLLRHSRMHAVQTELQYLYLYKCLLTFSQKHQLLPGDCTSLYDVFEREYQALIESQTSDNEA